MTSSYIVVQTLNEGFTEVYQTGSCYNELLETPAGLRFRQRLVVYDTARVRTLLATPAGTAPDRRHVEIHRDSLDARPITGSSPAGRAPAESISMGRRTGNAAAAVCWPS